MPPLPSGATISYGPSRVPGSNGMERSTFYDLLLQSRLIGRGSRRVDPDGLDERAIARAVPHGETHPRLAGGVERNRELLRAKRPEVGGRDDLAIDLLAVAPHDFDERQRERPLDIGADGPLRAGAGHRVVDDEDLAGRREEVAVAQRLEHRADILVRARRLGDLDVVDREVRVGV